ncbi:MAG TPA: GDP-mannose 4,6-dehydratase [Kouleothrix sp.]|uniref:GDP-mannose 4,6-dehydratase n=1 Tax=Kouleothrix sp. TaxID=2779161 RepID=UPI002D080D3D|nr:GDP-mannose 4,6-dehydratase [Kouleothrix sp.]HRC76321.1 GDP-mannose 4,6-dehydratase [Kouleothrix sp.]
MKHLITGGAGFIGCNLASALLARGEAVTVLDNLSRPLTSLNLEWLREQYGARLHFVHADIRDAQAMLAAVDGHDVVYHLAGQVAVTTSVADPRGDFEANALGTLNVLEAARLAGRPPIVFFASTNKVYGGMETVTIEQHATRYMYRDLPYGVAETQLLDFHSPYGCSKGAADQYVRDYARIYGLKTVVFRQSCLAADQPVLTPFGTKPIAALRAGDVVHNGQGWTRVKHVWKTGVKPVRRLTTMNGMALTLTPDHRMVRPHGLYSNQQFTYGDFLAVLPEARYAPAWEDVPDIALDAEEYLAAVQAKTSDPRCLNEATAIAERLLPLRGDRLLAVAEIVGRLFGDGNLSLHQRISRTNPSYYVQHYGLTDELSQVAQWLEWLGLPTSGIIESISESAMPSGHVIKGRSYRIQQQTIAVFTLFEQLGVPVGDKVRVAYELPAWVSGGHRLVKRAFLRGFFGAELGRVYADSYIAPSFAQSKDVEFLASGRRWLQQLRDLLAEFGIETSCFEAQPTIYKRGTTVQMTVRLLGGYALYPKLAAIGYGFSPERSRHLNTLLRWTWTHTTPEWFDTTSELYHADGPLHWDSLAQIEELGETDVYDLEVEDDSHVFIAGGMQVSNCIYGPRQFGVEDQGWAAHFVIAATMGRPLSIYGDGKQVRDMLYIDDLVAAYMAALERIDKVGGEIFNVGGGIDNTLSIWAEFGPLLERLTGNPIAVRYGDWRPGDQPVYVSDIRRAEAMLGWRPQVAVAEGIERLVRWVQANRAFFSR